jgi:hypothetical protein
LTDWQFNTMNAMKENLELLIGARGSDSSVRALTAGQVTVSNPAAQRMTQITAQGVGFTVSGVDVASLADYVKLASNVQQLANDVASLRATVNTLINQLTG